MRVRAAALRVIMSSPDGASGFCNPPAGCDGGPPPGAVPVAGLDPRDADAGADRATIGAPMVLRDSRIATVKGRYKDCPVDIGDKDERRTLDVTTVRVSIPVRITRMASLRGSLPAPS